MTTTTASQDVWSTPLTPPAFLGRAAEVFADREAVVYGERRMSYAQLSDEVTRVAHALRACGVKAGDRVAYLLPNIPEMLVAHFAVPLAGGVLVAINTRLAPAEVGYIHAHSGATVLVVDAALHGSVATVLADLPDVRQVVTVVDPAGGVQPSPEVPGIGYAELCALGGDDPLPWTVQDERSTISINYTSGTTGRPKGVMYHHRGAYLNSLSEVIHSRHVSRTRYLWTLPMFHCNGWCTVWAITAIGGTHVCLRAVDPDLIWDLLDKEAITHLNGSPTVLVSIANSPRVHVLDHEVVVTTAGAPPSPTVISTMDGIGATVVHVYGLTETYGPYTVCEPQDGWDALEISERSKLLARQGVGMVVTDGVRVVDEQMRDVPRDGITLGEVVMRGNNVMTGYFADPQATAEAFRGGWFHSGDLGVWNCGTAPRTSLSRVERTSRRSRSKQLSTRIPVFLRSPWSAFRTRSGASGRRPSWCPRLARPRRQSRSSRTSARRSPTTRRPTRARWTSHYPRPRPARSARSSCARPSGPGTAAGCKAEHRRSGRVRRLHVRLSCCSSRR